MSQLCSGLVTFSAPTSCQPGPLPPLADAHMAGAGRFSSTNQALAFQSPLQGNPVSPVWTMGWGWGGEQRGVGTEWRPQSLLQPLEGRRQGSEEQFRDHPRGPRSPLRRPRNQDPEKKREPPTAKQTGVSNTVPVFFFRERPCASPAGERVTYARGWFTRETPVFTRGPGSPEMPRLVLCFLRCGGRCSFRARCFPDIYRATFRPLPFLPVFGRWVLSPGALGELAFNAGHSVPKAIGGILGSTMRGW